MTNIHAAVAVGMLVMVACTGATTLLNRRRGTLERRRARASRMWGKPCWMQVMLAPIDPRYIAYGASVGLLVHGQGLAGLILPPFGFACWLYLCRMGRCGCPLSWEAVGNVLLGFFLGWVI